jgi:alpha-beta hydrolase superfamily lysophospholipase
MKSKQLVVAVDLRATGSLAGDCLLSSAPIRSRMLGRLWQRLQALPWWHPYKQGIRLLIYLAIAYVVLCIYLYVVQGSLIYAAAGEHFSPEEVLQESHAAGVIAWSPDRKTDPEGFVRPDFHDPAPRGTIVLVHGNGDFAWEQAAFAVDLSRRGFRTYLYEYPGYGGRPGSPSERTIVPDLQALIRALDKAGLGPVYLWGHSLGAGVAAAACADESLPVHGLLLITPWDTLPNVGASQYPFIPVHWFMTDRYDSVANLAHFAHPIFLARSDHDEIIPPRLSINLYAHLPEPKQELVFANAGHNTWPGTTSASWLDEALDFIAPKP